MVQIETISIISTKFIIPFLVGGFIFFSVIIAPNIFAKLDSKNARIFIRTIFPKLYTWGIVFSLVLTFLSLFYKPTLSFIFLLICSGFLFSKYFLVKWINQLSDIKNKTKQDKKKFAILHTLSVVVFISQILLLTFVNFKI